MAFAIYRTTKLKLISAITGSAAHNKRSRHTPNADPERTVANEQLLGFGGRIPTPEEFVAEWQRRSAFAKRKKDAVLCQELVLGTSPEFYAGCATETERLALQVQWQERAVGWLKSQFGDLVLGATLHCDETTPHLCAYVIPLQVAKDGSVWLSAKRLFNPLTLVKHQDGYSAAVADLGLVRGISGSRAKHTSLSSHYAQVGKEPEAVRQLVDSCEALALNLPVKESVETSEKYAERVRTAVRAQTAGIAAAARKVESIVKTAESDRRRARGATETSQALVVENRSLKDLANQVRDIPLAEVMARLGYGDPVIEAGAQTWRTGEHVINASGEKWYDHKASIGGGKAIDLVKYLMQCDFADAVGWLAGHWSLAQAAAAVRVAAEDQVRAAPRKEFQELWNYYAAPSEFATRVITDYLTVSRGLDRALVARAIREKWLHGSAQRLRDGGQRVWCVFPHKTCEGQTLGATLRAADEDEGGKRCIGNKTEAFFSIGPLLAGDALELAVVESPVDALSYLQRRPSSRVISVGGASIPAAVIDMVHDVATPIAIALDDDPAGRQGWLAFVEKVRVMGAAVLDRVARMIPRLAGWACKDWNDLLRAEAVERTASKPVRLEMPPLPVARPARGAAKGKFLPKLPG